MNTTRVIKIGQIINFSVENDPQACCCWVGFNLFCCNLFQPTCIVATYVFTLNVFCVCSVPWYCTWLTVCHNCQIWDRRIGELSCKIRTSTIVTCHVIITCRMIWNHFLDPVGVGETALPILLGRMKLESVKKYITKDVPTTSNVNIELNSPSFQLHLSKFPAIQSGSYFLKVISWRGHTVKPIIWVNLF